MRIKKKEAVIPFRETLAFRMIIVAGWVIVFFVALFILAGAYRTTNTVLMIVSGVASVAAAYGVIYNLDHLRDAKVPKQTLNRMKKR